MEGKTVKLEKKDNGVFVLTMIDGDNRINPTFESELNKALDIVEQSDGPTALVTVGTGKFYSNGLDLKWMGENPSKALDNLIVAHRVFARLLNLPVPTIAAINGHAYAAGMMLALAHDFRVMRDDRGFLCLPEVDLHMPFTPGMNDLIRTKITDSSTLRDAMIFGKKFAAKEALSLRLVDVTTSENQVLSKAIELAATLASKGDDKATLTKIKGELYKQTTNVLLNGGVGTATGIPSKL